MSECKHEQFDANVAVGRILQDGDDSDVPIRFTVEVKVDCKDCGQPLEFQGLPVGIDTHGPTMSVDGLEARLVAMPKGKHMLAKGRVAAIFREAEGRG